MAEEKTILTVDLYDNVLTEKTGDFTGKIRITGTTRTSDISNRIVKKRTEVPLGALASLQLSPCA